MGTHHLNTHNAELQMVPQNNVSTSFSEILFSLEFVDRQETKLGEGEWCGHSGQQNPAKLIFKQQINK